MDYYLNEYSLRGQFKNTDKFMESLRKSTLPVLDKIKDENESILWKKILFGIWKYVMELKFPGFRGKRMKEVRNY